MTENDLPAGIQNFIEATNRGDSDAFVAAFTEDAYLNDWGREFHGHEGVRSWNRTDNIGVRSHFELVRAGRLPGPRARLRARSLDGGCAGGIAMLLEVPLVVFLGPVERGRRGDLSDDLPSQRLLLGVP